MASSKSANAVRASVLEAIERLNGWRKRNGWAGYDPYGRYARMFSIFGQNRVGLKVVRALVLVERLFRITHTLPFHHILRLEKYLDPKTFAYFGQGYLFLSRLIQYEENFHLAQSCGDWLVNDACQRGEAMWGHPFVWYGSINRYFHRKNNPNLYISGLVGHYLLDLYEETGERKYLDIVERTCETILSVPHYSDANGRVCFWYIRDRQEMPIHNGNIYAASLLLRAWSLLGKGPKWEAFREIALRALDYHQHHQNPDGSWYYFGPPFCEVEQTIDNRHTGYVLDAMKFCYDVTRNEALKASIIRGAQFYEGLFDEQGASIPTPGAKYPVIVHDLAQGIYTFANLAEFSDAYIELASRITRYAIANMQAEDGHFYYSQINKDYIIKFPYMRYSQAPMFRALCKLVSVLAQSYHLGCNMSSILA